MTLADIAGKMEKKEVVLFQKEDSLNSSTSIITALLYDKDYKEYYIEDDKGRQFYLNEVYEINPDNLKDLNIVIEGAFEESHHAIIELIKKEFKKENVFYKSIKMEVIDV